MIHKYFEILKNFIGDYKRELYGRELINKVSLRQKSIALTLKGLENQAILKSKKKGNIKFYSLNLKNPNMRDFLAVTELTQKTEFLSRYKTLAHIFKEDDRVVGIFGSYAKQIHKSHSDIDVFIIGKKKPEDYNIEGKKFDLDISIKYFTENEFKQLLNKKNALVREIIENHVLLFSTEKFIKLIWEDYYSLD